MAVFGRRMLTQSLIYSGMSGFGGVQIGDSHGGVGPSTFSTISSFLS